MHLLGLKYISSTILRILKKKLQFENEKHIFRKNNLKIIIKIYDKRYILYLLQSLKT